MDRRTFLHMTILIITFVLLIGLFILFLEPIFGLLYLAFSTLTFVILWHKWAKLRSVLTMEKRRIRQKVADKVAKVTEGDVVEFDVSFHPNYQLVYTKHGRNQKVMVDKETFVIGRSAKCDLVIPDPIVSKEHCRIVYQKYHQTYYLEDMNSSNGTYIGTKRLDPNTQEKLLNGATLSIAGRPYRFTRIE